jgi:hypothetical protein
VPPGSRLKTPSGRELSGKDGKLTLEETGISVWMDADGKADYAIAVDAARQEATTATVSPDEIIAAVQPDPAELGDAAAAVRDDSVRARLDRNDFWWYLAVAAAALFVIELWFANKTLRH